MRGSRTPAYSATERRTVKFVCIACFDMILSNKQKNKGADQTARMCRSACDFIVNGREDPNTTVKGPSSARQRFAGVPMMAQH